MTSRYVQFTRPSLFAKLGLICETIDRDERDRKQREIVKAESVLPVYHASYMNACVSVLESIVRVVYTLLIIATIEYHCLENR